MENRIMKFRAWDTTDEKMLPWDAVQNWQFHWVDSPLYNFMQFTGLKDKDGKEIYEGDIVRFDVKATKRDPIEYPNQVGEVKISSLTTDLGTWQAVYCSDIRVIGNVYETPELIKS